MVHLQSQLFQLESPPRNKLWITNELMIGFIAHEQVTAGSLSIAIIEFIK